MNLDLLSLQNASGRLNMVCLSLEQDIVRNSLFSELCALACGIMLLRDKVEATCQKVGQGLGVTG